MDIKYPTRCQIIDVSDAAFRLHGWKMRTPDESKPHIGKQGTAHLENEYSVRIRLDDGSELMGSECWWVPMETPKA